MSDHPVLFRETSANTKLGPVEKVDVGSTRMKFVPKPPYISSTYLPIEQTCPETCPLKPKSRGKVRPCYADAGFTGFTVRRLERHAAGLSAHQLVELEAKAIDESFEGGRIPLGRRKTKRLPAMRRDLRLHISGDVQDERGAEVLSAASHRWHKRGGGTVFTYTHAWRSIHRDCWREISVLASCETIADAKLAMDYGYLPALLVGDHPAHGRAYEQDGMRIIPCPAETRDRTCVECRLCMDRHLPSNAVISFSMHGPLRREATKRVVQLPLFKETA